MREKLRAEKANWIEIIGGVVTGSVGQHIATVLSGGGDYTVRHVEDNVLEVDLRVVAQDNSGTLFRFISTGYDYLDQTMMQAMDGKPPSTGPSDTTEAPDLYGFEIVQCNTSSPQYRWITSLFWLDRYNWC